MIIMDIPWTAPALLALVPIQRKIQAMDQPVMTARTIPANTPGTHTGAVAHDYATVRVTTAAMA